MILFPIKSFIFFGFYQPRSGMVIRKVELGLLGHLGPVLFFCMENLESSNNFMIFGKSKFLPATLQHGHQESRIVGRWWGWDS